MHVKTNCKYFKWKKSLLINGIKIDKNILMEPKCNLNKLEKTINCPDDCKWFEKR